MKNVVEDLVRRTYQELLPTVPDACGCELCREDVMVYALNRLPPHYVATLKGEVLTRLDMQGDQGRADVAIAVMEAFRAVGAAPRHTRKQAPTI